MTKELMIENFCIPEHLRLEDAVFELKQVNIENIYVGIKGSDQRIRYKHLYKSPIYIYARSIVQDDDVDSGIKKLFKEYNECYRRTSTQRIEDLIKSIKLKGFDENYAPIAFRSFKRILPFKRYDLADGHHRAAVLAALGASNIELLVFQRRRTSKLLRWIQSIRYAI